MNSNDKYSRRKIKFENDKEKLLTELFTPRLIQTIISLPEFNHELKNSLFIFGMQGRGKTVMAARILWEEVKRNYIYDDGELKKYAFISVPKLLLELRNTYSTGDNKEFEIIEKYTKVDVLVLDDLGIEKMSDWVYQMLNIIISERYEQLKTTIFTSNYSLDQLAEHLGDLRISSRIMEMCEIVELTGKDYRLTKK